MLGYSVVSIVHWTLTTDMDHRIFNVRMWSFCIRIHTRDLGLLSHPKDLCTEFDSGGISGWAQSLAINGHPSIWWPRSIVFSRASAQDCSAPLTPYFPRYVHTAPELWTGRWTWAFIPNPPLPPSLILCNKLYGFCGRKASSNQP